MITKERATAIYPDINSDTVQIYYPLDILDVYYLAIKLDAEIMLRLKSLTEKSEYKNNETLKYLLKYQAIQNNMLKKNYYWILNYHLSVFYESGGIYLLLSLDKSKLDLLSDKLNDCFQSFREQLALSGCSTGNENINVMVIYLQIRHCFSMFYRRLGGIYPDGEVRDELINMADIYEEASKNLCNRMTFELNSNSNIKNLCQ
ncbi:MAG: hypothetical protein PHO25_07580 [Syntrophomonadaceae bacterium]|nr:hypothetical protein [Syntrophomonadaceae bacterium]